MNERNVAALTKILLGVEWSLSPLLDTWLPGTGDAEPHARRLAEILARRGVLVPSAITDEQGFDVGGVNDFTAMRTVETEAKEASQVRSLLERIAKGEPHPYRLDTVREANKLADELARETCEHGVLLVEKCIDCDLERIAKGEGQGGNAP